MADTTTIITGATDGALEKAFGTLPPWASQKTSVDIQNILNKSLKTQNLILAQLLKSASAKGQALTPDEMKALNKEVVEQTKNLKKNNAEGTKKLKSDRDQYEEDQRTLAVKKKYIKVIYEVTAALGSFGTRLYDTYMKNITTFDELSASGVNVMSGFDGAKDGFQALSQMSQLTGVRFTELSKSIVQYNTAINSFGLGKFTKTVAGAKDELAKFGFDTKEAADLMGAYLTSQKGFTDVNSQTQEESQKNLVKFGERITKLSQATGMARTELLANIEAISQSIEANLLASSVGADAAESTMQFIGSFKDKSVGQSFLKMMTDVIKPLNSTFMSFQKTGFGGFGQKLMNFTQSLESVTDPEEKRRLTAEFAKAHGQELTMMIKRGKLLSEAGVREGDEMMKVSLGLQQQGRDYKDIGEAERAKQKATAEASKNFQNELEKLMAVMQSSFAPMIPMLITVTEWLGKVNKGLILAFEWLGKMGEGATKLLNFFGIDIDVSKWTAIAVIAGSLLASFKLFQLAIDSTTKKLFGIKSDDYGDYLDRGRGGGRGGRGGGRGGGGRGGGSGGVGRVGRAGGGALSSGAKMAGGLKGGLIGAAAGITLDVASSKLEEAGHTQAAAAADIASTAAQFAGMGAMLGSIIPGLGNLAGGVIGGAAGAAYGTYQNWGKISGGKNTSIETTPPGPTPEEKARAAQELQKLKDEQPGKKEADAQAELNKTMEENRRLLAEISTSLARANSTSSDILRYTKAAA